MKPHLHAGLAKSGVSVDIGPAFRARFEGGTDRGSTALIALRVEATLFNADVRARATDLETAWAAVTVELTADGRRAECPCSERVETKEA